MSTAITNIFTLLGSVYNVIVGNPLLAVLVGITVASLIFGMLMSIFKPRRKGGK